MYITYLKGTYYGKLHDCSGTSLIEAVSRCGSMHLRSQAMPRPPVLYHPRRRAGERVPLTISATKGDDIRIAFISVVTTTKLLAALKTGDELRDVAGPLGMPSDIAEGSETVIIVGGGVGVACTPILAQAAKDAGNYVIGIIGARNRDLLIFEDDMRAICDELYVTTDDGSYVSKGSPRPLKDLCESGRKIERSDHRSGQ